jgi:hypothetical protein
MKMEQGRPERNVENFCIYFLFSILLLFLIKPLFFFKEESTKEYGNKMNILKESCSEFLTLFLEI